MLGGGGSADLGDHKEMNHELYEWGSESIKNKMGTVSASSYQRFAVLTDPKDNGDVPTIEGTFCVALRSGQI